jgi:proline iminopeptidase
MSEVHEGHVPVPGARLFFREVGTGPTIVVLHGGPDFDHHYLLPEMDRLASAFHLIYYDQRGRGRSSRVHAEDVGIDSEVLDLDAVRRHFDLDAMTLLGHSWGGLLAMEYATRFPERISRLILMNPAPASHADLVRFREGRREREPQNLERMRELAATPAFAAGDIEAEAAYYRVHYAAALRRPEWVETVVARLRVHFTPADVLVARAIENRLYDQTWNRPDYDLRPGLGRLKAPTLVIHGDGDFVPLECSEHIARAVPGARLVVLEDCGHFSYLEKPIETFEAIRTLV